MALFTAHAPLVIVGGAFFLRAELLASLFRLPFGLLADLFLRLDGRWAGLIVRRFVGRAFLLEGAGVRGRGISGLWAGRPLRAFPFVGDAPGEGGAPGTPPLGGDPGASPSGPESRQGDGRSVAHPGSPALVGGPCARSGRGAGGPGFWVGESHGGGTHLWVPGPFPAARRAAVPMATTEVQALGRLRRGAGAPVPCSKSPDRGAGAAEHPS